MSFEVACSNCQGRLRVEQAGLVACPHCGTHLNVNTPTGADATGASPESGEPAVAPPESVASPEVEAPATETPAAPVHGEQMPYLGDVPQPAIAQDDEAVAGASALDDDDHESVLPGGDDVSSQPPAASPPVPVAAVQPPTAPLTNGVAPAVDSGSSVHSGGSQSSGLPEPDSVIKTGASSSIIQRYASEKLKGTVSKGLFALVVSYSSAVTLAALYLAWQLMNGAGSSSQLESLPDIKPRLEDGQVLKTLVPEGAAMPLGHTLALGETRRFGNLEVTPLKVTRGPVKFEFFQKDGSKTRPDGDEILQLWMRFKNVSSDQEIAPLDELVYYRVPGYEDGELDRANTFVCARSEKKKDGHRVLAYEWNDADVWNLRGQDVEFAIPPGETTETYVPTTEEGISELLSSEGPLVWRVHFRKGYSPKRYGVTTVVEVNFDKSDIVAATEPQPSTSESAEGGSEES